MKFVKPFLVCAAGVLAALWAVNNVASIAKFVAPKATPPKA